MSKYYKVLKDHPYWEAGAIIQSDGSGYTPIDDLFLHEIKGLSTSNYVEDEVVQNSPDFFERVYKVNILKQVKYLSKSDARKAQDELYKSK